MEAIKKQASKLREQVAKQQQAILRQLGKEVAIFDDAELEGHHKLQNLYNSTRAVKHFQRDIAHGVEAFVSASKKELEIVRKLAVDCSKYGTENQRAGSPLASAVLHFGTAHGSIEDENEATLGFFIDQVSEPLRASIAAAPLEDARHLTHHYDRIRQEVEAQAAEVIRRQSRCRDPSVESVIKLKNTEARLTELRASMVALQKEATAAMLSVEDQQQYITFQKLISLVDAERSYHQNALSILVELHAKMTFEMQLNESSWGSDTSSSDVHVPPAHEGAAFGRSNDQTTENESDAYFIAKVRHSFDAQTDGEISLAVDDHVVVRQVAPNGWSEGECMGKAGWFPSAYVERQDKVPTSKLNETITSP